ncbi:F0F1 ATP synthase subunit gamma [Paraliomyxa miuraensis]|uniref:F0F1 ATP synthase subunit gamma n=1 Tax=Paraliomyxa miuraensis TaxID=376150 RepID=UPI0022575A31|nr:F0F1 ATP synthase subunit gamma [Paraliomyxa miuraensis]MCX4244903.1 F0F1 ATP synthase subunit gamma [Paraliomyxa miuraensis]
MTTLRQLEDRLRAWQSFRGIAGATRTLAAAQSMHWVEVARRAQAHLARCLALRDAYPGSRPSTDAPRLLVGLGSDLGLCGPFNRAVAERLSVEQSRGFLACAVVGERLRAHMGAGALVLPAATSFEQAQNLATQLELLLSQASIDQTRLVLVLAAGIDPDGRPQVTAWNEPESTIAMPRPLLELVEPELTATAVASLTRHARLLAALARSAASETEARWRTMNRAHEAADRRIAEQEREIRKQRQELVTQEMLEARQGARATRAVTGGLAATPDRQYR